MEEKEEFCENIRTYERIMYAYAYSIVANQQDAEDVLGEAILRAYVNFSTLKNKHSFKAWILRIVHNAAIEIVRKRKYTVELEKAQVVAEQTETLDLPARLVLRDSVNQLKQPYKAVAWLYYFENLSVAKIAAITETSVISVRQQLSRARKQLREVLNKEDFSE